MITDWFGFVASATFAVAAWVFAFNVGKWTMRQATRAVRASLVQVVAAVTCLVVTLADMTQYGWFRPSFWAFNSLLAVVAVSLSRRRREQVGDRVQREAEETVRAWTEGQR